MSLERRMSGAYYYQAQKVNGRVIKRYIGGGEFAALMHQADQRIRHDRNVAGAIEQREILDQERDRETLVHQCDQVEVLAGFFLALAGFHQHKGGEWRRKRQEGQQGASVELIEGVTGPVPYPVPNTDQERRAIVRRAFEGPRDQQALEHAIAVVRLHPECSPQLLCNSLHSVLHQRVGDDPTGTRKMAATSEVEDMRAALAGPSPSPLESMLIDRLLACWVHLSTCQSAVSNPGKDTSVKVQGYRIKRLESANRMYLQAVKTLATVRRLQVPAIIAMQLNIGEQGLRRD